MENRRNTRRPIFAVATAWMVAVLPTGAALANPGLRGIPADAAGTAAQEQHVQAYQRRLEAMDAGGTAALEPGPADKVAMATIPGGGADRFVEKPQPRNRRVPSPDAVVDRDCGRDCRVFVTSSTFTGELGGIDGADSACAKAAKAAGLGERWQAWLSCTNCGPDGRGVDARARLRDAKYSLVSGELVAPGPESMLDCDAACLAAAIDRDEFGHRIDPGARLRVWTGTFGSGSGNGRPNCRDWSTGEVAEDGEVGELTRLDEDWTSRSALTSCSEPSRLYCFER